VKRLFLIALCAVGAVGAQADSPAGIPAGYKLLYAQDFTSAEALKDFVFTDAAAWKWAEADGKQALELHQQSQYKPPVRSPVNIALIAGKVFGDFILEAQCLQTGKEYGHRDMCIFYGFQNPQQFYYTHIATKADPNAHNCFLVNQAPRKNIAKETTSGVNWGLNVWHKVRLERKVSDGTIRVWFDDMSKPIMIAEDKTHGAGWVGFGSFDDTGRVANVRIWGPAAEEKTVPAFPRP
jgi:hypothetical protein